MEDEKSELIELFGIHFERLYNISPLGGRILATLVIDGCKSGLTFDELVEKMQASKSSVSTNLNLLLKTGRIEYFTVAGDRKKYFKAAPLSQRLKNYLTIIDGEKMMIDRLMQFRKKNISCVQEEINFQNMCAYKEHVLQVEQLLLSTINKFKSIEIKNQSAK
jgi:DNA-binding transcriptional regulator GbsR (MarR family)